MKHRILVLSLLSLVLIARPAACQDPGYVEEQRFIHELRNRGDTDLARALIERLQKDPTTSDTLRNELPYEMALCRKAEAVTEPDSTKRLRLYAEARAEFVKFRDSNPNSSRLAETRIDIADITVLEGKTELSKAMARETIEAQAIGLLDARKKFDAAGVELSAIAADVGAQVEAIGEPKSAADRATRAKLEKTRLRAELSVALNLFDIAQTYHPQHAKASELIERGNKVKAAVKALEKISSQDDRTSEVWQAKAWLGRCEHELGLPKRARESFTPIIRNTSAAAADGRRLARYFLLLVIQEQLGTGQGEKSDSVDSIIESARAWERDYPRALSTPEGNGVRFLLAEALLTMAGVEKLPALKKSEYRAEAKKLLDSLSDTENEFTDRAKTMSIRLIGLGGGFTKDVKQLTTFDECYIRAQYEAMEMGEDAKTVKDAGALAKKRDERVKTILDALERGLNLPDPKARGGTKSNNARAMLAYYYLTAHKYPNAIRIGEAFARESNSGPAAVAAVYALQAYGASVEEREANLKTASVFRNDDGKVVDEKEYKKLLENDRAKMLAFAGHCEKQWEKEAAGNLARYQLGLMNMRNGKLVDAVKLFNKVSPDYPSYAAIRFQIADMSFKAAAENVEPFPDQDGQPPVPFRERALRELRDNIKEPNGASVDQTRVFFQAKTRLGLEWYRDKKYAEMQVLADQLLPKVATASFHDDPKVNAEIREHFQTQLKKVQLFARVGLADAAFKAGDLKKVADLVQPAVDELAKTGATPNKNDPQLGQALQALLSMGLSATVQTGDLGKVRAIVAVYGKAVGENAEEVGVPEVLKRLVGLIRTQTRELKEKNKVKELDESVKAFTVILDDLKKQQKKEPTPPEFLLVLAQCYASMDKIDDAIKVLEKIPQPKESDMEATRVYQGSRLVYLRMLRQQATLEPTKKEANVKKASDLLNTWMGTKEKPGWASKSIDAHKERLYLYEMEDETGAGFNKAQALVKSLSAKNINPNDVVALNHYLECYYYMVYFLYANGKKQPPGPTRTQRTEEAATRLVDLENQYKDFGTEEMKRKFQNLLDAEPPLKLAYEKAKKK